MADTQFTHDSKFETKSSEKQAPMNIALERISEVEKAVEEMKEIKKDFMVIVGIFAAVVAFFTVEAKIFDTAKTSSQAFGLSCFIIAGLLSFLLLLRSTLSYRLRDSWIAVLQPVTIIIVILLWLGSRLVS